MSISLHNLFRPSDQLGCLFFFSDLAFVDRADIKMHIGNPSTAATYAILSSAITELVRTKIIALPSSSSSSAANGTTDPFAPSTALSSSTGTSNHRDTGLMDYRELEIFRHALPADHPSFLLYSIASKCAGMSGRSLRKLPFLAHAFFVQSERTSLDLYLKALDQAVDRELQSRKRMAEGSM